MRPFLMLARTVARTPSTCAHCKWALVELDQKYAITVQGVTLIEFCSVRCAIHDAVEHKRGLLTVVYAERAA